MSCMFYVLYLAIVGKTLVYIFTLEWIAKMQKNIKENVVHNNCLE
jgi:hypothetical protein